MKQWQLDTRVGDLVRFKRLWNIDLVREERFDECVKVLGVKENSSRPNGRAILVRSISGKEFWIDSSWFQKI